MKKKRSSKNCTCPYYKNSNGLSQLTDKIVGNIMDIEDLVKEGKETKGCPYYAARY